jgi:prevent-host-death family protein
MIETTVGIRAFKARLSEYMRQVKQGQSLVITEHGKPVGRILPVEMSLEERIESLRKAGLVEWSGRKLRDIKPPAVNRGDKLASDVVVELREPVS